jgi:zinc transporter, ZIP family
MDAPTSPVMAPRAHGLRTAILIVVPVVLLAGVIALFMATGGAGVNVAPAVPVETLVFDRTILRPGQIELHVQNTSPQPLTVAQVNISDAFWPFSISPEATLPRLGRATILITYPWVHGEPYSIDLLTSNAIKLSTAIPAASETVTASRGTLLSFTLIGLYVGIIPVFLGLFWYPALRRLGPRWMMFLMAITAGLLIFLGIDAGSEALELANEVGGPFQGVGLVGIGIVGTFLLLDAISRRQTAASGSGMARRLAIATMIAVGIGLHNLGEGLAIGASYATGAATLGTFLVIGFIIQNITEGLGILAPILRHRPSLGRLALMGLVAGAPAIAGVWAGGLTFSQPLAVLFLAVGAGAVFEVVYEIGKLIAHDAAERPMPLTIFGGVSAGMLLLYITGVLIK